MHELSTEALTAFNTSEVRWFGRGELPDHILDWFMAGGTIGAARRRTDSYQLNGEEDRGVKLRATSVLEVKTRLGFGRTVSLPRGPTGTIEEWRKTREIPAPAEVVSGFPFADITKTVVTRSFSFVGGEATSIDLPDRSHTGCHVDLTSIQVNGVHAWCYAFEAYGDPDLRTDALLAALSAIEDRTPHPGELADLLSESLGYPAWINSIAAEGLLSPDHSRWPTAPDASGSFT